MRQFTSAREGRKRGNPTGENFCFGFAGTFPDAEWLAFAREIGLKRVILFSRNTTTLDGLIRLNTALRGELGPDLWICLDQENGVKNRITEGIPQFPNNRDLAGDLKAIRHAYGETARYLKGAGVDCNLVPVADCRFHPENSVLNGRSFGRHYRRVAEMTAEAVRAVRGTGLEACAKHFPGLGNVAVDPHLALPRCDDSLWRFRAYHFAPFRAALAAGTDNVMTTHLLAPALDRRVMATRSVKTVQFLRRELGFRGPLLTDDLEMGGMLASGEFQAGVRAAWEAGHDALLICEHLERQIAGWQAFHPR